MTSPEVLVSSRCCTYNHEKYIRQCLDGFVMQKTDFAFEAIVHDDASTDGTQEIIKEYARNYPDIIKPILETENLRKRGNGSVRRVVNNACRGKYVAFCEGDDFWTDPIKLQSQVDFLESHDDFTLCFHSSAVLNENNAVQYIHCESIDEREYFTNDIFPNWIIATASVMCRREVLFIPIKHREMLCYGDISYFLMAAKNGRLWGMNKQMSVYRINSGGVTQIRKTPDYRRWIRHEKCLRMNFPAIKRSVINKNISSYYYSLAKNDSRTMDCIKDYSFSFLNSPAFFFGKLMQAYRRKVKKKRH